MSWKMPLAVVSGIAGIGALAWLFMPSPLEVDGGDVIVGPLTVTIDDQGETRAHDRFMLAAPVSGRLLRMELHAGDAVAANLVVAQIAPLPQSVREREAQVAAVAAAEALHREAVQHVRHGESDLALARRDLARVETLVKAGSLPQQHADQARNLVATTENEVDAARFREKSAAAQVKVARSGLIGTRPDGTPADEILQVRAPVAGRVLRIHDASERVVAAGTPLLTLGNLDKLEVVIEMLSSEAVNVHPGMPVLLEGWGGDRPLRALVRLVEPFAFTKVSALGVEEKRINVIVDFVDAPGALGDGFRVTGRIVTWERSEVLKVPASALFRCAQAWCVFVIQDGRAVQRAVNIGQRNALEAEVLDGVTAGQRVIRHPGNELAEGMRVAVRPAQGATAR